ncbi:type II CAAX endopeptidase family protein [Klenkia sp. LSe6-5]|uniref:Type II CAAX endopeptidase family protein n=1 Tax=Klenkia sesuvii TaxID=3103137 RepID=A0ABU8DWD6_9ACTN
MPTGWALTWTKRHPATAFTVLALLLSWAAWLPLLAQTQGWVEGSPASALHLLGSLGPAGAAILVTGATRGRHGLAELARRLTAWRARGRAWAFALVVPPGLLVVAAIASTLAGGGAPSDVDWSAFGRSEEFASLPLVVFWLANLTFFGFGEEIGWRGFLQPELERRRPRVLAANLVAVVWALWHLPLFGITPSYRAMPALGFVGFAASIWVASWIFAWLLQIGRGSLLVVAVFHAWFDISTTSPLGPGLLPTAMGAGTTLIGLLVLRHLLNADQVGHPGPATERTGS